MILGLLAHISWAQRATFPAAWVSTFEVSPATYGNFGIRAGAIPAAPVIGTLRYRFGVSVGGSQIMVRLSNELGDRPLRIAGASIGIASTDMNAVPGSLRRLTFSGKESVEIPAGAPMLSDPIHLELPSMAELIGSLYFAEPVTLLPPGGAAMMFTQGDAVMSEVITEARAVTSRPIMTSVLVAPARPTRAIVAMGDSITDGVRDKPAEPHGWVATLADRLNRTKNIPAFSAVSAGISGNQIMRTMLGPAGLTRMDRDVLSIPGVSHVILLEGINDIGFSGMTRGGVTTPLLQFDDLVAAYRQIITRSHSHGLKIYAGTLLPAEKSFYFSDTKEELRQRVNTWLRNSKEFDGVVDFDTLMRDPERPSRLNPKYDSGDHLHPNALGYKAMGDSIDLSMFR